MTKPGSSLAGQSSKFDDVCWNILNWTTPAPQVPSSFPVERTGTVLEPPQGLKNGMNASDPNPSFWTYKYEVNGSVGLRLSDIRVANVPGYDGPIRIIDEIGFGDLEFECEGLGTTAFDLAAGMAHSDSSLTITEDGAERYSNDDLYQRGIRLVLVNSVQDSGAEVCRVTLQLSLVLRGAKNDFDPGGIPVALLLWPQITWSWQRPLDGGAGKRVVRFRGSVKTSACNSMAHETHLMGMSDPDDDNPHSGHTHPDANVASFFTDNNVSPRWSINRPAGFINNVQALVSGAPTSWSKLFDYAKLNLKHEFEFVGVHGPNDGDKFAAPASDPRTGSYIWPIGSMRRIVVEKADRQGAYDNIHIHAKMESVSSPTVQIHAPFCGHSCLHMHWRWGMHAADGAADEHQAKYRGWSSGPGAVSNAVAAQPLVPPNQRLKVALCRPGTAAYSDTYILGPNTPPGLSLDALDKMIYYQVDIFDPDANTYQVIWPHGLGWAFRYALPSEASVITALAISFNYLPWNDTQQTVSDFFVDVVYPGVRYISGDPDNGDQIPDGSHWVTDPATTPHKPMEDL
jgi:hypothetical protein